MDARRWRLIALAACVSTVPPLPPVFAADGLLDTPQWVTTDNGVALKRQSDANTKLPADAKSAKRIFDQAIDLTARAVGWLPSFGDDGGAGDWTSPRSANGDPHSPGFLPRKLSVTSGNE